MTPRKILFTIFLTLLLLPSSVLAAPLLQDSVACSEEVVVQADDWLSKIAEKVYGDVFAYPAIAEATNARHAEDASFAAIENVDVIEVGWKLCVPGPADAEAMVNQALEAPVMPTGDTAAAEPTGQDVGRLVLATTTSTDNSGLLNAILPDFEQQYAADVEVIAVGTGQAIQLGQNGDADVILVHARSREDAFVDEGYGVNRQDVMYNDFVIVGPANDPAGINGMTDVAAALEQIAASGSSFISRGDDSGTHTKEQGLWQAGGVTLVETAQYERRRQNLCQARRRVVSISGAGYGRYPDYCQRATSLHPERPVHLSGSHAEGIDLNILVEGDSALVQPLRRDCGQPGTASHG